MYVCYVDESGHCGRRYNPQQPVEVLCGVITDFTKLFKTQREHREILSLLRNHLVKISELKAIDVHGGRHEWKNIDPTDRDIIFEFILKRVETRACKLIICPIDSNKFFQAKTGGCQYSKILKYPYEAGCLNIVLSIQRHHKNKKSNKGKTLVIFDEQREHDENLLNLLGANLTFTDGYTGYVPRSRAKTQPDRLDQIIDVPYFAKSHLSILIQMADFVAFVINRYIMLRCYNSAEKYEDELSKIEKWYNGLRPRLINHTATEPPGGDPLCQYYRRLRPENWSAKKWLV